MKAIFTIFFILICYFGYSQCDTNKLDTQVMKFNIAVNTGLYDYYEANGFLLWKGQKFDSSLIPVGGWATPRTTNKEVSGYAVWKASPQCYLSLFAWLDSKKKRIDGRVNYIIIPK